MSHTTTSANELLAVAAANRPAVPQQLPRAARAVLALLGQLRHGTLDLQLPDGSRRALGRGGAVRAALAVHDWGVFGEVLTAGDIGFAEAYIDGRWSTPDLPALLRLANLERERLEAVVYGNWWGGLWRRVRHALNRNSRRGSRRNIHAHYDLGNAFYERWLDRSLTYSSAWFRGDRTQPLEQAQRAKIARALDEVGLAPGQRLLEIGCGWGSVALAATLERGAQVVGLTLSREQLALAQRRLASAGVARAADLRLQDYRDVDEEPFDAVVSIEMFEAVGEAYWPAYFDAVHRALKPGGRACIQVITIRDDLFERYRRSSDFIQQYVFPGGMLPSPSAFERAAARAGFTVERGLAFGGDYAETLRRWRTRFHAEAQAIRPLGFDDAFMRTWDFYLAYCEAAFDTGSTDVVQYTLRRD